MASRSGARADRCQPGEGAGDLGTDVGDPARDGGLGDRGRHPGCGAVGEPFGLGRQGIDRIGGAVEWRGAHALIVA
jgi:hypothetical protein